MTKRGPYEPGPEHPVGTHTCLHDGGDSTAPPCGKPGTLHIWGKTSEGRRAEWVAVACDEHAMEGIAVAWDWHRFGGVCAIPGTAWFNGERQGEGTCVWPEGEAIMAAYQKETSTP